MARSGILTCILSLRDDGTDALQIGGGIHNKNANYWIEAGASKVFLFCHFTEMSLKVGRSS